jgi:pantetheine-phosphate adenylyltransferase
LKKPVYKYTSIAVGGTFDQVHKGHRALLSKAFDSAKTVFIGVTSDEFVARHGKKTIHTYDERVSNLRHYLDDAYPERKYLIAKLDENFGPAVLRGDIEAIAVSEETKVRVAEANKIRRARGYEDLATEIVPMVPAYDGVRISSSRIRAGEIDLEGLKA